MNILITSASRKVSLIRAFQQTVAQEGGGKVIAVDVSPLAPALYSADEHYLVPLSCEPAFLAAILRLCDSKKVKLLIPTRDEELPFFAEHIGKFVEVGTTIMVPSVKTVNTCQDKCLFIKFCEDNGFGIPKCYDKASLPNDTKFPLFVKPRFGKGGRQTICVNSKGELDLALKHMPDAIIQEFVDAPEYTIDLFADFSGRVITVVPRERIIVFCGESFVTKTCKNTTLINEAKRLAEKLRLIGHNTIQCFLRDGVVKFIEVNPRYGGAAHLGFMAGAPTPVYLIRLMKGENVEPMIGEFKDGYVMLRYTEDLFLDTSELTDKRFL